MLSAVVKPLPSLFRLPPLSSSSLSLYLRVSPLSSSYFHSQSPLPRRSYSRHAFLGDHHLSCSMPNKPLRVAVLLSGGVDSSVALRLLHAAGHSSTAFYLKIWFQEGFENFWNQCPWEDDLKYAKHVCEQVDVPLKVLHLTDEYWERVVSDIIEEYRCGRTPNPDVLCNTRIKFGAFMDAISGMEYEYIASVHYAKVVHPPADQTDSSSVLELSQDMVPASALGKLGSPQGSMAVEPSPQCALRLGAKGDRHFKHSMVKDQTYFLSHLCQTQLKRLLFPLGCVKKEEVRKLATEFDLPNKDRKDSQGICFLGKIKFSDFVGRHIGEMKGIILEAETGDFSDTKNNVVFVSRNYYSIDKRRRVFRVGSLRWLSGKPPGNVNQLRCKVRHGPGFYSCSFEMEGDVAVVHLDEDDQGLAAGQFAAFYEGTTCIGSGVILESWDDMAIPAALVFVPVGVLFLVSGLIVNLIQLVFFIIVRPFSKSLYRRINKNVVELLWLQLIWLIDWWACIKVNLYADAETLQLLGKEHALVLSNHRSDIDWLIGWVMAQRAGCLGSSLAIMKKEAKYLPIIGWSMWFSDYIFLERSWDKDEKTLTAGFKRFEDFPMTFWLALFVEGTRFTQEKLEAAQEYAYIRSLPSPRNVLIPRTKGFVSAVSHIRSFVPAVYDCTLTVRNNQPKPTLLRMFSGQSSELNLQLRRHKMSDLPETDDGIAQWCQDLFITKDAQLETYFTKDVFSDLDVHQINRPIKPLIVVIVWVCLLMYGGFKLLQWLSMVASWEIICLFVVILVIATITMQVLIQSSESHRSTPAKRPLQEQLISA
ncbi:unnamed protein product [Brassica napus]|uniref:tRNA-5-taurinomethyluridine 2-sulfurtransferase n=3 Tax=Brassica napus TaxID=3708 RepID=A0A816L2R4_BRANA|nr:unnamed protein product [Brassica napus]